MQKLITIGLKSYNFEHGNVEEHLADYLSKGWKIDSFQITSVEVEEVSHNANIWVAVVLSHTEDSNTRKKKSSKRKF